MRIVPVIDLRAGRAVAGRSGERARYLPVTSRLRGGAAEDLSDPRELARALAQTLAPERLYVADLDRIEGTGDNDRVLASLLEDDPARVILWDGGLAHGAAAPRHPRLVPILASESLADAGEIDAVTAGTTPTAAERPWLGLDLDAGGLVAGARELADLGERRLLRRAAAAGLAGVAIVLLGLVGTSSGLPRDRLCRLREDAPDLPTVAGGGIASIDDLLFLRSIGCEGALLATALHDGRISPADLRHAGLA